MKFYHSTEKNENDLETIANYLALQCDDGYSIEFVMGSQEWLNGINIICGSDDDVMRIQVHADNVGIDCELHGFCAFVEMNVFVHEQAMHIKGLQTVKIHRTFLDIDLLATPLKNYDTNLIFRFLDELAQSPYAFHIDERIEDLERSFPQHYAETIQENIDMIFQWCCDDNLGITWEKVWKYYNESWTSKNKD